MVENKPSHIRIRPIKFKGNDIDLFPHLVVFFTKMHFQLVDVVGHSFVLPRTYFERVEPFEVDAADRSLAQDHGEWELVRVVEGN